MAGSGRYFKRCKSSAWIPGLAFLFFAVPAADYKQFPEQEQCCDGLMPWTPTAAGAPSLAVIRRSDLLETSAFSRLTCIMSKKKERKKE